MDKYQETFQTWEKVAKSYQEKFMHLELYNDSYDDFLNMVPMSEANVMEVGCGPGNVTHYLLSKRKDLKIYGVDVAESMIKLAKVNNPTAEFAIMDVRDLSTLKARYDGLVAGFCIPYLSQSDCVKFISDCKMLLANSGVLYLSFVEGEYENSGYLSGSSGDRVFFYYHNLAHVVSVLEENSFVVSKTFKKLYDKGNGIIEEHIIILSTRSNY